MNPHHLELFYHVAKAGGVSRAVRQMPYGIQQPSVSAQVNALERDLGVVLYERRPFKLTAAGETLFKFAEPFFSRITEVRGELQGVPQIRVGASPIVLRDYLPPVLHALRRQFSRLNLILRAANQPELLDAVTRGELDVVISLIPDDLSSALEAREIVRLPLVLLVARKSKITSARTLWSDPNRTLPLIALAPGELLCQRFQQTLLKLGSYWLPQIEMDSLDLIAAYVEHGFGAGLSVQVPDRPVSRKLRALPLPEFPPLRMGVIFRREANAASKVSRVFLDEINRQAERLGR